MATSKTNENAEPAIRLMITNARLKIYLPKVTFSNGNWLLFIVFYPYLTLLYPFYC